MKKRRYYLSASLISGDMRNLGKEISLLEKGDIDYLHFDVMDGLFVPRFGLYPELLGTVKHLTKIPVNVHLMVNNPEIYVPLFAKVGADIITVHAEGQLHLHRLLQTIKNCGVKVGLALNPATPLCVLDHVIGLVDYIMIMAINPGIVGHGLIPEVIDKISRVRELVKDKRGILIEVDGGVNFSTGPRLLSAGADILVCGTSSIYKQDKPLDVKIKQFNKLLDKATQK